MCPPADRYHGHSQATLVQQLTTVKRAGETGITDERGVRRVADANGLDELVDFIDQSTDAEYMVVVMEMERRL